MPECIIPFPSPPHAHSDRQCVCMHAVPCWTFTLYLPNKRRFPLTFCHGGCWLSHPEFSREENKQSCKLQLCPRNRETAIWAEYNPLFSICTTLCVLISSHQPWVYAQELGNKVNWCLWVLYLGTDLKKGEQTAVFPLFRWGNWAIIGKNLFGCKDWKEN